MLCLHLMHGPSVFVIQWFLILHVIVTNCCSALLSIMNGHPLHPGDLPAVLSPSPPLQFFISLSVAHLMEYYHHKQACPVLRDIAGRSVTVRPPPSFHAPLALMCSHAGGLCEATQTPSWWNHLCSLSHALTPQTPCPFLSSRAINVADIFEVTCRG